MRGSFPAAEREEINFTLVEMSRYGGDSARTFEGIRMSFVRSLYDARGYIGWSLWCTYSDGFGDKCSKEFRADS